MSPALQACLRGIRLGLIGALLLGGALASAAMLVVMLSLTAQTAAAAFPALNKAPLVAPPTAAGPGSTAPDLGPAAVAVKPDGDVGASVANAMTAVGTAIAAVTLILSVGTTWFASKLQQVETATEDLKRKDAHYAARLEDMRQAQLARDRTHQQLIDARFALREWVDSVSTAPTRYSHFLDLSAHLEILMSTSQDQRKRSFHELTKYLPDEPGTMLEALEIYSISCHQMHGGTANSHSTWCAIFDPMERTAYLRQQARGQPMF